MSGLRDTRIRWVEIDGTAHILEGMAQTVCGLTLTEATVIQPSQLDGCMDCISIWSDRQQPKVPPMPDDDWRRWE